MGGKGFFSFTWEGWMTGVLFLKKPWGPPTFTSWICLNIPWSLFPISGQMLFAFEAFQHIDALNSITVNSQLIHYINSGILLVFSIASLVIRILLVVYAKPIARLLNQLHSYHYTGGDESTVECWRKIWGCFWSMKVAYALSIICNTTFNVFVYADTLYKVSVLSVFGYIPFQIMLAILFLITDMPLQIALFIVVTVYTNLVMIFEDYCINMVQEFTRAGIGGNEKALAEADGLTFDMKLRRILVKKSEENRKNGRETDVLMREFFLKKLDDIEDLFAKADCIMSPLTLILIMAAVLITIPGGYGVVGIDVRDSSSIYFKLSFAALVGRQLVILMLLAVGELLRSKVVSCKEKLGQIQLLRPSDPNDGRLEYDLGDVLKLTLDFDWRLSACDFFTVDLKLLGGIMATSMSYIVILVQTQIQLQPAIN